MQSKEANRHLTTILIADVVEYSRLMAADEEGTHAQLKANRRELIVPKETEYHGRTVKLMGDGALMEFGSVTNALNFAIDVQNVIIRRNQDIPSDRQICYRIGINIGEMIRDGDDLYGGGVNICARLESLCEPNGIFLTEDAYRQVENTSSIRFRWLGEKKLKNIPDPVSIYQVLLDHSESRTFSATGTQIRTVKLAAGVALAIAALAFLAFALLYPGSTPVTDSGKRVEASQAVSSSAEIDRTQKTSIAVLPFENLSGDPEQAYFSDGVSEDIITDLSQLPDLAVIARSSSFSFRNSNLKIQEIGTNLGANFLLQGSIRKAADRIRINAQLIHAQSGHALWAERYDGKLADVFALQDEITGKIVTALSIRLSDTEKRQIKSTDTNSFEAYDLFLQGRRFASQAGKQAMESAIEIYKQVIELDPDFARAYGALAVELARYTLRGFTDEITENRERAIHLAKKAEAMDPDSLHVQWALGFAYMSNRQFEQAITALEKAVSLAPSYADGYGLLALIHNNLGNSGEAIEFTRKAMSLNPHYTWEFPYNLGRAHWAQGDNEAAVPLLEEALDRNPQALTPGLYLTSTYVQLGRNDDAEWIVSELELQSPDIRLSTLRKTLPLYKPELRQRLFNDLSVAGMKE